MKRERERVSSIVCLYMYKCSTCLPSLSGLSITILLSHMVGFFSHFKKPPKHMVILVIYNNITESFGLSNYCFICVIMRYFLVAIINTKTFLWIYAGIWEKNFIRLFPYKINIVLLCVIIVRTTAIFISDKKLFQIWRIRIGIL